MAEEAFDEFTDATPKSKKPLLFIVLGAVLLLGNGAAAFFFMSQGSGEAEAAPVAAEPEAELAFDPGAEPGPMMPLEHFVLNLDEPEHARYLRVAVNLELENDEATAIVQARMPRLRDRYISHLSSQSVAGLSSIEDKDRLREELLEIARSMSGPRAIRAVYFTEFIIQ
jgi:flagellar protein FliL